MVFNLASKLSTTPLLAASAAAIAIAAAPSASAANPTECIHTASSTVCQKDGSAQIQTTNPGQFRSTSPFGVYGPFFWQNPNR